MKKIILALCLTLLAGCARIADDPLTTGGPRDTPPADTALLVPYYWEDLLYLDFGTKAAYVPVRLPLSEICQYDGEIEGAIQFSAPARWRIGEGGSGVLCCENGEELLKIGEIQFFGLLADDTLAFRAPELLSLNVDRAALRQGQDNEVGYYYETDRFIRSIQCTIDNNYTAYYLARLDDQYGVAVYFFAAESATADDLAIYDEIVSSFTLVATQ